MGFDSFMLPCIYFHSIIDFSNFNIIQIIIKELDLHIMAMLEEGRDPTFSQTRIATLASYITGIKYYLTGERCSIFYKEKKKET